MRIRITASGPQAKAIADGISGALINDGRFTLVDMLPTYTVIIDSTEENYVLVDSVDSLLEELILQYVGELANAPILLDRRTGPDFNNSPDSIKISVPPEFDGTPVIIGVVRALLHQLQNQAPVEPVAAKPPAQWKLFGWRIGIEKERK